MITKDDFIKRWRFHLIGMAVYGHCEDARKGPLERAASIQTIPDEVTALLGKMYDDVVKPVNGTPQVAAVRAVTGVAK